MKIKVRTKGFRITLWAPLSTIQWKWLYRILHKNAEKGEFDFMQFRPLAIKLYHTLKVYKRKNGSFVLLDVHTNDGTIVKIVI